MNTHDHGDERTNLYPAGRQKRRRGLKAAVGGLLLGVTVISAPPASAQAPELNDTQIAVARVVHDVGKGVKASDRAMLAAFEAAIVEGTLQANPPVCGKDGETAPGRRDGSAGLFQQKRDWVPVKERPKSARGWCTPGQDPRLDPKWAATHFFKGSPGHPGALAYDERGADAHGKKIRTAGELAQATQVSAFPKRYDQREADARALLKRLAGNGGNGNPYRPEQICGQGFKIINKADLQGAGTVYLLWRGSTRENCVVTLKTRDIGKATPTSAYLQPQGERTGTDSGKFKYYAGPVTKKAPRCVKWGGMIGEAEYKAPDWKHCSS